MCCGIVVSKSKYQIFCILGVAIILFGVLTGETGSESKQGVSARERFGVVESVVVDLVTPVG